MSHTKECCVCYEAIEHLITCNHLVCESCYSQVPTCPMCRAPLEQPVEEEDSDFDIDAQGTFEAAFNGHIEIVRLMLAQRADAFNSAMSNTTHNGHENTAQLMLEKRAGNLVWVMHIATRRGHEHIVRLMLDRGANNYNEVLSIAASQGHLNIVELIRERRNPSNCHH